MLKNLFLVLFITLTLTLSACSSEETKETNGSEDKLPVISINLDNLPAGVTYNSGEIFVEIGTNFTPPIATAIDEESGDLSSIIIVEQNVNLAEAGSYSITYSVTDSSGNTVVETISINVIDPSIQEPFITLNGNTVIDINIGETYIDPGASATDAQDGEISSLLVIVNQVNTQVAGTYTITYNVTDSEAFSAQQIIRTVNVIDTISPVLTLQGDATINWPSNTVFIDPGVLVTDNSGSDLSNKIVISGNLNVAIPDTYTLTYSVEDSAGNSASISRTLNIYDSANQPVISRLGESVINIEFGETYIDSGATAEDAQDGNLTASIQIVNPVNTDQLGSYIVSYNVTDSSNFAAFEVIRTVNVVDLSPPSLTLTTSDNELCSPIGSGKIFSGIQSLDAVEGDISSQVLVNENIDFTVEGSYQNVELVSSDLSGNSTNLFTNIRVGLCYDIIYVRYPDPGGNVALPQGEQPYTIIAGADLMLLKKDGTEEILVDCETCSVMDPYISYDAKTVYYSLNEEAEHDLSDNLYPSSWIYKIHLDDPNFTPIRLTFDNGFDSKLHAGNIEETDMFDSYNNIRDMAPVPLADGRLLFTSTRIAFLPFNPDTRGSDRPVSQMYIMDDHNGTAITPELANMEVLESGSLHLVQHPIQLKDGRILFSSWQDVATRYHYSMTNLMTVHPDGTNLQQFTEPHNHIKVLDHFITQLSSGDIASGLYYPSFDFGYGLIVRFPIDPEGSDFMRDFVKLIGSTGEPGKAQSRREFDRKGTINLTTHSTSLDLPSPNQSGKYAMPSAVPFGQLLVAYSAGYVNHFGAACNPDKCEGLKSGIYIMPDVTGNSVIDDPSKLIMIKDEPEYNEIWPRAVVEYTKIHGQSSPDLLPTPMILGPQDDRIDAGEATSLVGSSSMYNREPLNESDPDPFQTRKSQREWHDGNWTIQGAEAGVFDDSEIYGVRLIATPSTPFTSPTAKGDPFVSRHLPDSRQDKVPQRFGSYHFENWQILGEFPLAHKDTIDDQGNPDSSWLAKIPADTPMFIQTIDKKGLTLTSELTWRALKPGEKRADCGGCHAHSIPHLDMSTTQTGTEGVNIKGVPGVSDDDKRIQDNLWDLTSGSIPLLLNDEVEFMENTNIYTVEYHRDILPLLQSNCLSCHSATGTTEKMPLDGITAEDDAWAVISNTTNPLTGKPYHSPQRSRYIRIPQARQSLLAWIVWGERLDGRDNDTRDDDIDYTSDIHEAHIDVVAQLSDKQKRDISRWIDLGGPVDFAITGTDGFGYTEDPHLPIVHIQQPNSLNHAADSLIVGFNDAHSGLDFSTLSVEYYPLDTPVINNLMTPSALDNIETTLTSLDLAIDGIKSTIPFLSSDISNNKVLKTLLPGDMQSGKPYVIRVSIKDNAGNIGKASIHFIRQ